MDRYKESHRIARVSEAKDPTTVMLLDSSRYGFCKAMEGGSRAGCASGAPGRFVATGWLSEVDSPGEYYFDPLSSTLFVYPPEGQTPSASTRLGSWAGPSFAHLKNTSFVTIRDLVISGVADHSSAAMVVLEGGEHNTIGGCTLRSSSRAGVALSGGNRNRLVGNDVYDVGVHVLSGDVTGLCQGGKCPTDANAATLLPTNVRTRTGPSTADPVWTC